MAKPLEKDYAKNVRTWLPELTEQRTRRENHRYIAQSFTTNSTD